MRMTCSAAMIPNACTWLMSDWITSKMPLNIKRTLFKNVVAYSVTWLVLAGLDILWQRLCGSYVSLWVITFVVVIGACADWLTDQLKSQQ